jgi:phosphoheptose isomerase
MASDADRERAERAVMARTFAETIRLHETFAGVGAEPVLRAVDLVAGALARRGKLLAFGNGGSASDAQHLAGELVGRYLKERGGWPAIALSVDTSVLTAIANDYSYDRVFARQVEALGEPGDVAFGISTSGRSANVVAAFETARARGLSVIALTGGDGGPVGRLADVHLNVPDRATPRVQEVHRTIMHVICELVENRLTENPVS